MQRANSMRILLRQNILLSLNFEPQVARETVPIAAETIDLAESDSCIPRTIG